MQILVFKTKLNIGHRITEAAIPLNAHPDIIEWNVDIHDIDNILRVVSRQINACEVENLMLNAGFYCEELQ